MLQPRPQYIIDLRMLEGILSSLSLNFFLVKDFHLCLLVQNPSSFNDFSNTNVYEIYLLYIQTPNILFLQWEGELGRPLSSAVGTIGGTERHLCYVEMLHSFKSMHIIVKRYN